MGVGEKLELVRCGSRISGRGVHMYKGVGGSLY